MTADNLKFFERVLHEEDLSPDHETQIILIGVGIIISMENLEIMENAAVSRASDRPTWGNFDGNWRLSDSKFSFHWACMFR